VGKSLVNNRFTAPGRVVVWRFGGGPGVAPQLAATVNAPGVLAAAGPFATARVVTGASKGDLLLVARTAPSSPIDDLQRE
jgi:hypothetical protein